MFICPDCAAPLSGIEVERCLRCDWTGGKVDGVAMLLSTSDRASPLFAFYANNYDHISKDDMAKSIQPERYLRNQSRKLADYVGDVRGKIVADIGAGKGYLARMLAEAGAKTVYAFDITRNYLPRIVGTSRIVPIIANAENLPVRDGVDVAVCTDTMEHVIHLPSFLLSLNRAVRLGGRAYVRVPYRENLVVYSPHLGYPYALVHLRAFNKALLRDTMASAGFRAERFEYDGYWVDRPRRAWMTTEIGRRFHRRILSTLRSRLEDDLDITLLPNGWMKLLMTPIEITVVATKTLELWKPSVPPSVGTSRSA